LDSANYRNHMISNFLILKSDALKFFAFLALIVAAQCALNSSKAQLRFALLFYKLRFAFAAQHFKLARPPLHIRFQVTRNSLAKNPVLFRGS
jgi:hypothetical protein